MTERANATDIVGRELRPLPSLIFGSRWLQLPLYLGLIVAQGVYVVLFLKELWHLTSHAMDFSEQQIIDLIATCGFYVLISMVLNVAQAGIPGGEPAPLR